MNELNTALEHDFSKMAALKADLIDVEELLEERPVDNKNMAATMEQRQTQIEELQTILPKLKAFDTKRVGQRCRSFDNDRLFKAFITAFDQHNSDLKDFKKLSTHDIKGKKDLKRKADELTRIALKQCQLDAV